jgi:hypothetical protein
MIIHNVKQGSFEWRMLRLGKVTGSQLKKVFASDNLSLLDEIISEQLTETWGDDDDYVSDAMQRGIDMEPVALDTYEQVTGVQLIRDGFIQSEKFPLLGYSPDGRIGTTGNVEVKCPTSKKHIQYLRQQQLPNDYKWQILGAFIINPDLQWNDFMSFDPRVSQRPYFIHRTNREDVLPELNKAVEQLEKFFTKLEEYKEEILFPITQNV